MTSFLNIVSHVQISSLKNWIVGDNKATSVLICKTEV